MSRLTSGMLSSVLAVFLIVLLAMSTVVASVPVGRDVGPLGHWPSTGEIHTIGMPGVQYTIRFQFELSRKELSDLQFAEFLEIDFHLYGFKVTGDWESYTVDSDLPGAQHDEAFGDTAADPTPAVTGIRVADLVAERQYLASISFSTDILPGQVPSVMVNWVPSRWADDRNIKELVSCRLHGDAPQWCIFSINNQTYRLSETKFKEHRGRLPFDGYQIFRFTPSGTTSSRVSMGQVPDTLSTSIQPGRVILSDEGHLYVFAGGGLFWFDRNDSVQFDAFRSQSLRLTGTADFVWLDHVAVHSIEASPWAKPRHKPVDGAFLQLYGTGAIYTMMYGAAVYVGSMDELGRLSGTGKAVMVPGNAVDGLTITNPWSVVPNGRIIGKWSGNHWDWYQTYGSTVRYVGNEALLECLRVTQNVLPQIVPASLFDRYTVSNEPITCDYTVGRVIFGTGSADRWFIHGDNSSVPYTKLWYPSMFHVYCRGGMNVAQVEITPGAISTIPNNAQRWTCPDNSFVRNHDNGEVFQWKNGSLHYVPSMAVLQCLVGGTPGTPTDMPGLVIASTPRTTNMTCAYEGKLIKNNAGTVYWVKDGHKRYVGNTAIMVCIGVRAGSGDPISVAQSTIDSYQSTDNAFCPYGPSVRFGKHPSSPTVWRIFPDGTRQHATSLCSPQSDPRFFVHVFPEGEIDGHRDLGTTFVATAANCAAVA